MLEQLCALPGWVWLAYGIIAALIGVVAYGVGRIMQDFGPADEKGNHIRVLIIAAIVGVLWPIMLPVLVCDIVWQRLKD